MSVLPRSTFVTAALPAALVVLAAAAAGQAQSGVGEAPGGTAADGAARTEVSTVAGHPVTRGAAAGYVADAVCATCHEDLARSFTAVGMSRSFARPAAAEVIEDFENNRFFHTPSGRWYEMERDGDRLLFRRWSEDEAGQRHDEIEIEVDWILGSGHRSRTYLFTNPAGELFQLPVAWYSQTARWGISPGFDRPHHLGLQRRVRKACMSCHNAFPEVAAGSDQYFEPDRYPTELPSGIGCQRCHGPGAAHVDLASGGLGSLPRTRAAVVNPARLRPELRDDVCFQCHMQPSVAIAGVRRLGVGAYGFRPGTALPDSLLHVDVELREERFEINHHPYRLLQSRCWQASERRLTCITCHDPHRKVPVAERAAHYRAVCLSCHGIDDCDLDAMAGEAVATDDCVACHMPQRRTDDIVQVWMTDHRIQRRPETTDLLAPRPERDPDIVGARLLDPRSPSGDLGALYLSLGVLRVGESGAPATLARLQAATRTAAPDALEPYLELGKGYLLGRDYAAADRALARALALSPDHPTALGWKAIAQIGLGNREVGLDLLRRAWEADPRNPDAAFNLGRTELGYGRSAEALPLLRRAVELRPTMAQGWSQLGEALTALGRVDEARASYARALAVEPSETLARRSLERLDAAAEGSAESPGEPGGPGSNAP